MDHQASRRMRRGLWVAMLIVLLPPATTAQELDLGGFIKSEYIYDTRQVTQIREGQFHLFPLARADEDQDGLDDNATDNLLFAAFQSRLRLQGSGAQALGAQLTGLLEADFFGAINEDVSELRLRHAFVQLDWQRHQLLLGQYWSPLFTTAVFPQVINFNTGAPFQPFARFPQLRYTFKPNRVRVMAVLSQQRDAFQEIGGRKLQQQSALPAAHLHVQYVHETHTVGAGGYLKTIRPNLNEDRFTAGTLQAYAKTSALGAILRAKVTYGNDLTDHLMTGGFVQTEAGTYEALRVMGTWVDAETTGKPLSVGLFGGYLTNLGCRKDVTVVSTNARAPDLEKLWRLAPRLSYTVGKLRLALELEATRALYAGSYDTTFRPTCTETDRAVTNVRGLFAAYYFF